MQTGVYIEVPPHVRRDIQKRFGITQSAISLALSYQRMGGQSEEVRNYALQHPEAKLMCYLPQRETIRDSEDYMEQIFDNGWSLRMDKVTGLIKAFKPDGSEDSQHYNPTFSEISKIQQFVKSKAKG